LFAGCLLANTLGPYGIFDIVLGSAATLAAALVSYKLRSKPLLVPLPPVLANGLVIGPMLYYVYSVPLPLWACILWIAAGEAAACYGIGLPLLRYLSKRKSVFR